MMQFADHSLFNAMRRISAEEPLIALCESTGKGRLILDFEEVAFEDFGAMPWPRPEQPIKDRYVGILSYDDFSPAAGGAGLRSPSRVFRVLAEEEFGPLTARRGDIYAGEYQPYGPGLDAEDSDDQYLANVAAILDEIRRGRFYQVNLLRYFPLAPFHRHRLIDRLECFAENYSCLFDLPGLRLVSFSPERFVSVIPRNRDLVVRTEPIKGTISRGLNAREDQTQRQQLADSQKDRAELSMIVDLMRNDLSRVSERGSVAVVDRGHVHTFTHVHHLVARVESLLRRGISIAEVLSALCPAGSITGCPKIEVMTAIRERERRDRGYLMGNVFSLDCDGGFDSSVLIRSAQQLDGGSFEYAAGSGIVIGSEPAGEMAEIKAKCRVMRGYGAATPRQNRPIDRRPCAADFLRETD